MTASSSVHPYGPAIAVGAAGMVLACISGEVSGLLAAVTALYICRGESCGILSIATCGLAVGLFVLLPRIDIAPDIEIYLQSAAFLAAVIAVGLLIQDSRARDGIDRAGYETRDIVESIPGLAWTCDAEGRLTDMNANARAYLDVLDIGGFRCRHAIHPDDLERTLVLWSRSLETGEELQVTHRARGPDGTYRWFRSVARPKRDLRGKIVRWYGTGIDIDDQKGAEESARATEANLRSILDNVPGMIATADSHGRLDYANKRDLDYFGVVMSDLAGHNFLDVIHPEEREATLTAWLRAVQTGEPTDFQHRFRRHDGTYRWFHSRVEPTVDQHGNVVRWYGLFTDIDDRKSAEDALRDSERQFRLLIDAIPALVWCATPDGEPSYLNKRMVDFTGMTLDSFEHSEGRSLGSLARQAIVHPDELAELERLWSHSVRTEAALGMRHRLRRVDGVYRWVDLRAEPLRNGDGVIVQWYGVCVDIEDETRMQDALRATQDRLSRASQAASLAELSASIAHEVNQPLAAVIANSHACQRWLSTEPPNLQRAQVTVERIIRDANGAAEVVSRVRALFKQTASTRLAVDLNEVISEVCKLITDHVTKKGVSIETDLEENLPLTLVDRVQIQQVLVNLTRNGIDAMESSVDYPKSLLIRSRRDGMNEVLVEIWDCGGGVEDVERIFEPFFTTKENGMGMGLAICRSIIEAHDGRLRATKNQPRGTTLTFTLPAYSRESQ